jgi:hypothetical protein
MSSTHNPNRLIFSQTQTYTTRLFKRQKVGTMLLFHHLNISLCIQIIESIIVVDLDQDEKIVRLVDQWNGKELPTWLGAHFLRVLNAKITPWLVSVPKRMTS